MRTGNSAVTVWDLCSGVCAVYVLQLVSVHVSVCAGGVKVTLNSSGAVCLSVCACVCADTFGACAMALIVCIHLHLQRKAQTSC